MRRFANKWLIGAILAGIVLMGYAQPAEAAFKVRVSDGITTKVITDGGAGDLNPVVGAITAVDSIGVFVVTVATSLSKPLPPNTPGTLADMELSVTASASGSGVLTVDVTDTGFVVTPIGGKLVFRSVITGTAAATPPAPPNSTTIGFQAWADFKNGGPGNEEFGGSPVNPAPTGTVVTNGPQSPQSDITQIVSVAADPNPFSMSSRITLTSVGGGSFSSDGRVQVFNPAPPGLMLALSGAPMLGLLWWRRKPRLPVAV